jgi:hypothetical protein
MWVGGWVVARSFGCVDERCLASHSILKSLGVHTHTHTHTHTYIYVYIYITHIHMYIHHTHTTTTPHTTIPHYITYRIVRPSSVCTATSTPVSACSSVTVAVCTRSSPSRSKLFGVVYV